MFDAGAYLGIGPLFLIMPYPIEALSAADQRL